MRSPIGIIPRFIIDEHRKEDIISALLRFTECGEQLPVEWVEEYNEIITRERIE